MNSRRRRCTRDREREHAERDDAVEQPAEAVADLAAHGRRAAEAAQQGAPRRLLDLRELRDNLRVPRDRAEARSCAADRAVEGVVALKVAHERLVGVDHKVECERVEEHVRGRGVEAEEHVRDQQREYRHDEHRQGAEGQVALVQFRLRREPEELQLALAVPQRERGQIEIE